MPSFSDSIQIMSRLQTYIMGYEVVLSTFLLERSFMHD